MDFKNSIEKFIEIFNRSNLSISKFASLIDKDRRTITSWIDRVSNVEISSEIQSKICKENNLKMVDHTFQVFVKCDHPETCEFNKRLN